VNCRSAQQLISPYLDQQLTGAEMLAMQQHLAECAACAAEHRQVCEVRRLLRSLSAISPDKPLETRITQRVAASSSAGWKFKTSVGALWNAPEALSYPQRGRRLAGALALSCVALLMLAAPFAPSTGDAAQAGAAMPGGVMEADVASNAAPTPFPMFPRLERAAGPGRPLLGGLSASPAAWSAPRMPGGALSQAGASVTLSGWSTEPLDDEAVGGYAAGDAALADPDGR